MRADGALIKTGFVHTGLRSWSRQWCNAGVMLSRRRGESTNRGLVCALKDVQPRNIQVHVLAVKEFFLSEVTTINWCKHRGAETHGQ